MVAAVARGRQSMATLAVFDRSSGQGREGGGGRGGSTAVQDEHAIRLAILKKDKCGCSSTRLTEFLEYLGGRMAVGD